VQSDFGRHLGKVIFMINSVDLSVGARLRTGRIALGMSHEKLADALGVSLQQVLAWELGVTRIGASSLSRIALILGVSPEYFFKWDGAACHAH
jgi:transcriptional regulator with XRE-family HTH domain